MVPLPYSADYFAISPHGIANTHLDALCHVFNQGKMYNGYSASDVTPLGARNGAIDALKDGIVSRGVLIDVPTSKAASGWSRARRSPRRTWRPRNSRRLSVEEGDVLFVRTGRHALEKAKDRGLVQRRPAGLGAACLPWLHARKVAALGSDGASDVMPSGYEKILPITRSRSSPGYPSARQAAPGRARRGLCHALALDVSTGRGSARPRARHGIAGEPAGNFLGNRRFMSCGSCRLSAAGHARNAGVAPLTRRCRTLPCPPLKRGRRASRKVCEPIGRCDRYANHA